MRTAIRNRLEMSKQVVAVELPARQPDARRWVSVLPVPVPHPDDPKLPAPGRYRIASFEIAVAKLHGEMSPYDGDLEAHIVRCTDEIDEIDEIVREFGANPDDLTEPWKCDYPL